MNEVLSVTDINLYLKELFISNAFLNNVTVRGEISNLKMHGRGHLYFSLKDENSKINCVMFGFQGKLGFEPHDGQQVQVKGRVSVYEASGSYQIYVNEMVNDGVGNLYELFEKLKRDLANEGLFDESHKKKLPRIPKKIGIITAPTGAAVKDIISTINRRFPLCDIIIFPTLVQGENAKENIVKMIDIANKSDVDLIILGRGGGSIEDLWAFNEEIVARAIYRSQKPIISGVGHEIDFTISDFVADLRAPTPTGAALLAVPDKIEILNYLNEYKARITSVIHNKMKRHKVELENIENNYILKNPNNLYLAKEQKLDILYEKLNNNIKIYMKNNATSVNNYRLKLESFNPNKIIESKINNINNYKKTLAMQMKQLFIYKNNQLEQIKTKLELLNPSNILNKGYSIVKKNGEIVSNKHNINKNDILEITLKNGKIISTVEEVI